MRPAGVVGKSTIVYGAVLLRLRPVSTAERLSSAASQTLKALQLWIVSSAADKRKAPHPTKQQ